MFSHCAKVAVAGPFKSVGAQGSVVICVLLVICCGVNSSLTFGARTARWYDPRKRMSSFTAQSAANL